MLKTSMSVYFSNDLNSKVMGETNGKEAVDEILLIPETGEIICLLKSDHDELIKVDDESGETNHYLGDNIIKELAKTTFKSNDEKADAIRKAFFSDEEEPKKDGSSDNNTISPIPDNYKESLLYTECIRLKEKATSMVAKKFIEKVKKKYTSRLKNDSLKKSTVECMFKIFENAVEGEDLLKDCKISAKKEKNVKTQKKVWNKKIDRKIKTKILQSSYPKSYKKIKKYLNKDKAEYKEEHDIAILKVLSQLVKTVPFPEEIEKFLTSLDYSVTEEWEKTFALVEGKRDFNKEEDKKHIIELLKKDTFSQDHAHIVIREVRDLWKKGEEDQEFDEKFGLYTAKILFEKGKNPNIDLGKQYRAKLKKTVEDEPVPPNVFTAGVEYSLLRLAAKAEGEFESNILEGKLAKGSIKAEADAVLAEGKANANFYFPNENGHHAKLDVTKRTEKKQWEKIPAEDNSEHYPANFFFDCDFIAPHTAYGLIKQFKHLNNYNPSKTKLIGLDIIGHTDAKGSSIYNQGLGQRRADAAYHFLKAEYVGLSHFFSTGTWQEAHIEFMQAVVNLNYTLYASPYIGVQNNNLNEEQRKQQRDYYPLMFPM
ncbi:hypothetical protein K5X82_17285 [Halosquirtibacter xylanolyticus]|uniref:hypothetical protein n=1 Tax=Halosquirtibacter xylanolyticus TaxID=3374599 RepID=UPI003749319E|nr:hypothetical protein K5X82_17285 [Prolixibacteraceae bacterium]